MEKSVDKIIALYNYIAELVKIGTEIVTDMSDHPMILSINDFPDDKEYITFNKSILSGTEDCLLSIKKPNPVRCPVPNAKLEQWLEAGWDDCDKEVIVRDCIGSSETPETLEYFNDDKNRVNEFNSWRIKRDKWATEESTHKITRNLFAKFYKIHNDFKADSESYEIIIANGIFTDETNEKINHPIITRRLKTSFDADRNIVRIEDTDAYTELYTTVLQDVEGINNNVISDLEHELSFTDFFPIGEDINEFMNKFAHEISSDCSFVCAADDASLLKSRFFIKDNPVLILRKRIAGTVSCIENIIKSINETSFVPAAILKLVDGSGEQLSNEYVEATISEQLAAVCGEDIDILLSKEANREQLEIAQRIEDYDAVVVQGPPGTGKTHTIANLLGHFLSQGKSILVTSYTKKALSVLKDKVEPGIQDLCVSMLDDSNADMQHSIENIADKRARLSSAQLQQKIKKQEQVRADIIKELSDVRNKIYNIKFSEQNTVIINGESVSPSEVARFVQENAKKLSYIPGYVNTAKSLPLELDEINFLYESNGIVSLEEEHELNGNLPNIEDLILPLEFRKKIILKRQFEENLNAICEEHKWQVYFDSLVKKWMFKYGDENALENINVELIQKLANIIKAHSIQKPWQIKVAADGHKGEAFTARWNTLFNCIESACEISNRHDSIAFGKTVNLSDASENDKAIYEEIRGDYQSKGKPSKIKMTINKAYKSAYEKIRINDNAIASEIDCEIVINTIELNAIREKCSIYWNELFTTNDVPRFFELDSESPETVAQKWIHVIKQTLEWTSSEYQRIVRTVETTGIDFNAILGISGYESSNDKLNKVAAGLSDVIPALHSIFGYIVRIDELEDNFVTYTEKLIAYNTNITGIGKDLYDDFVSRDFRKYEQDYNRYLTIAEKLEILNKRNLLISKLEPDASEWSRAFSNREGIHGGTEVPEDIVDAWKWNQYAQILKEISEEPFNDLLSRSVILSKEYKKATSNLAETKAWYHLIMRMEANNELGQNLEGWRQTVEKIGKGTGKNAPKLKKAARDLMGKCQNAVPCWIMTINKAMESLKPTENHFDIVIVDEASQANISSLAITYMADKVIIVGDDKQVSPMAVGQDINRSNKLAEMTIKNIIPNWQLFDLKLSLYALAATSYKPLMLKEHFRCVPDIIGYSNKLSYDFKIKPLRDSSSSNLLPAMVPYRVKDGRRNGKYKTNDGEARAISALMRACIEQDEYKGKTFGVISLLGKEQAEIIYQRLISDISPSEMERRQILCGDASNFQGDERDVIFLSMVDSRDKEGTLPIANAGPDDWRKKRYNVAVSRARDQLWIIHSLDVANDLKPDDMRKDLLDYASNPSAFAQKIKEIEKESESPFEVEVAQRLVARGYHIIQQWPVGAYRIDMVASCGNSKVAIECDGERWHSGEDKIREDMERQTILERSGWRFIRIRGSEFYTDRDATMERVFDELTKHSIMPENNLEPLEKKTFPLLERVKNRAADLLGLKDEQEESVNLDTIEFALNNKKQIEDAAEVNEIATKPIDSKSERKIVNSPKQITIEDINQPLKHTEAKTKVKEVNSKQNAEQISSFDLPKKAPKKKVKQSKTSGKLAKILAALNKTGWEYIDNSQSSDIIYLISDKTNTEQEKIFLDTLNCPYSIEKRGTVATNNRRAWRIMVKNKEK